MCVAMLVDDFVVVVLVEAASKFIDALCGIGTSGTVEIIDFRLFTETPYTATYRNPS